MICVVRVRYIIYSVVRNLHTVHLTQTCTGLHLPPHMTVVVCGEIYNALRVKYILDDFSGMLTTHFYSNTEFNLINV